MQRGRRRNYALRRTRAAAMADSAAYTRSTAASAATEAGMRCWLYMTAAAMPKGAFSKRAAGNISGR